MSVTVVEYVDDTYAIESSARRLIAKNLKIVTGTMTWSASSVGGSAGDSFDYTTYGSRFLWLGMTPKLMKTPTATAQNLGLMPVYDPTNKKIFFLQGSGNAAALEVVAQDTHPTASETLVVQFCLLVYEGGATAGTGLG